MNRSKRIKEVTRHDAIGVIPGVNGQRAFPTKQVRYPDPFIMLDHIGPQQVGKDYFLDGAQGAHPHRGFETLTFWFDGVMEHRDSLGNKPSLRNGGVQRMHAGSGIIHGGNMMSDPDTGVFHEIQLWVNVPASEKMKAPEVDNASKSDIPIVKLQNATLRVVTGEQGEVKGSLKTTQPTSIAHVIGHGEEQVSVETPGNYSTYVYVMKGSVEIEGRYIDTYSTVAFEGEGDHVSLKVNEGTELLVLSGLPIGEPIAFGGPFVMNTQEEIDQAYADFRSGAFGEIQL